jgi:hypothetical protein
VAVKNPDDQSFKVDALKASKINAVSTGRIVSIMESVDAAGFTEIVIHVVITPLI